MVNCHFIDIFKTFNPDETEKFRTFLDSTYFNKRKKLVRLYDIIKDYYPFFTDDNFTRENIFAKAYPDEAFNYGKINEGLSTLYKLALNYIKQVSYENNTVYTDVIFLEELRRRSLKNIFLTKSKKIEAKLNEYNELDSNLFLKQYLTNIETLNFSIIFGKNNRNQKVNSFLNETKNTITSLTNYYVSETIALLVNSFNYSLVFSQKDNTFFDNFYKSGLIQKLLESTKSSNKFHSYIMLLNCYFEAIFDLKDSQKYYDYKQKVFEQKKNMSISDMEYHISCLIAYCHIKKKDPDSYFEFSAEYINLQEKILSEKLFINSKSEFYLKEHYLNLLINYGSFKEKEKIEHLITYAKYLHPDFRQDLIDLSKALYHFLNSSYQQALSFISKINRINKAFEEKIYNLEIRIHYEAGNFIHCLESINLFKKQLRVNKLLDKKRIQSELSFLSNVEKLIKIRETAQKYDAEFLYKKIQKDETIPSKEWLLEKYSELYEKPRLKYYN